MDQPNVTLNATQLNANGAQITYNPSTVTMFDTNFSVHVTAQNDYDLKLSLGNSWAFRLDEATIIITLDGRTLNHETYDADLLLAFAAGDQQYFSFYLHLDSINNVRNRILDRVSNGTTSPVSEWIIAIWHREVMIYYYMR